MNRRQRSLLAVATLSQAFAIGVTVGVFPLFLEPLEASFSAPRTQIAVGPVLVMFALSSAGLIAGSVLDRGQVRRAMLFGTVLMAIALVAASVAPNLWVLALAALAAGFAIPFIGPLAGMTLVSRSFDEDQGRAFGIMSMGPALGSGFFAGLAGFLMQSFDWRAIYAFLALALVVVLTPIIWLVIPAQLDAPRVDREEGGDEAPAVELAVVLRRPVFWLSAGVFALAAGIATGWTNHVAAFLGGVGLGEAQVASLVAAQFWMGVPGALAFGMLADRFSLTTLFVTMLGFEALAFGWYGVGVSPLGAAVLGVSFGFVAGGLIPLYMVMLGQRLESEILGRAMGLSNLVMLPVMAVAALLAASFYERHGGYEWAATIFACGMLGSIAFLLLSNRSAHRSANRSPVRS